MRNAAFLFLVPVALLLLTSCNKDEGDATQNAAGDRAFVTLNGQTVTVPNPAWSEEDKAEFALKVLVKVAEDLNLATTKQEVPDAGLPASTSGFGAIAGAPDVAKVELGVPDVPAPGAACDEPKVVCASTCAWSAAHATAVGFGNGVGVAQCADGTTAWAAAGASAFATASAQATACATACSNGFTSTFSSFSSYFAGFGSGWGAGGVTP